MSRQWREIGAFGVFVALVAVASAASTALAGSSRSASSDAKVTTSRWQRLSALDDGPERELTDVTWAAGRAWFVVGSAKNVTVASARVRGSTLDSIASTKLLSGGEWKPVLIGSDLAISKSKGTTGISRLAGSGRASAPVAATPEPLESTPGVVVEAATRVGGRKVWALAGGHEVGTRGNFKPTLFVCCDASGSAVDLTRLIVRLIPSPPRAYSLGTDAKGGLWLAWIDGPTARASARMVQLDPATLLPRTSRALVDPASRAFDLKLLCAKSCRLVTMSFPVGVSTWAPGERTPTIVKPGPTTMGILAAAYRGARLAVAVIGGSADYGLDITVLAGDSRGAHAYTIGAAKEPPRFTGLPPYSFWAGTFTPSGFVFAQTYQGGRTSRVAATAFSLRQ